MEIVYVDKDCRSGYLTRKFDEDIWRGYLSRQFEGYVSSGGLAWGVIDRNRGTPGNKPEERGTSKHDI